MGFNSTYRKLQEVFPQLDARLLKAVAIEHPKDPDLAVEVVLSDVLPYMEDKTKLPHSPAVNMGSNGHMDVEVENEEPSLLTRRRSVPKNQSIFASTSAMKDQKRSGSPREVHEEPCSFPNGSLSNSTDDNSLFSASSTRIDHDKDCIGNSVLDDGAPTYDAYHDDDVQTLGIVDQIKTMPNRAQDISIPGAASDVQSLPLLHACGANGSDEACESEELILLGKAPKGISSPPESSLVEPTTSIDINLSNLSNALNGGKNLESSNLTDASSVRSFNSEKSLLSGSSQEETGKSVVVDALETIQKSYPEDSDHQLEFDASHSRTDVKQNDEKADTIDLSLKIDDAFDESVGIDGNSSSEMLFTRSVHLCHIDDLEQMIDVAKNNKKTIFSAMDSVINMMREVEECEKAAELAKEEAAKGGMDILLKVEELKKMLAHAKDANDMHAGEVYGEKAVLATELKELQSRLYSLSDERDKSLAILDEMRQSLETQLSVAVDARKSAEEDKQEKENLALRELAIQEAIMEKVVQESKILQEQAEQNSKLREFLMDRGQIVDTLQGEISVICQDVKFLKKNFDEHVPLSQSLSSSQTSCLLASSTSSLRSMLTIQMPEEDEKSKVPKSSSNNSLSNGLSAGVDPNEGVAATDHEKLVYDWNILDKYAEIVEPNTDNSPRDRLGESHV